jgi:hypothetical protein
MDMKKIYGLLIFILGSLMGVSCSDDGYTPSTSSVQVSSAETSIDAAGGKKDIVVKGVGITASAQDPWLNVNVKGNTITVSADANPSRESRSTLLTVKASNGDSTLVNVSQYGMLFVLNGGNVYLNDDAQTTRVALKHSLTVRVLSAPKWSDITVDKDSLSITVNGNNLGHWRSGYVKCQSGDVVDSFLVRQFDFNKDLAGEYYFWGYSDISSKATQQAFDAKLVKDNGQVRIELPDLGLSIPAKLDESTLSLHIYGGQYMGPFVDETSSDDPTPVTRYVWTMLWDENDGYYTWSSDYGLVGQFNYDETDNLIYTTVLKDDGAWGDHSATSLIMGYFTSSSVCSESTLVTTDKTDLTSIAYPRLQKIAGSDAKSLKAN